MVFYYNISRPFSKRSFNVFKQKRGYNIFEISQNDGGSFTLTTGIMMDDPIPQGASAAMANSGVKAFVKSAAIEMPRGIRINSVSPNVLVESLDKYGDFFPGL